MNKSLENITLENAPNIVDAWISVAIISVLGAFICGLFGSLFGKKGALIGGVLGGLISFIGACLSLGL